MSCVLAIHYMQEHNIVGFELSCVIREISNMRSPVFGLRFPDTQQQVWKTKTEDRRPVYCQWDRSKNANAN